MATVLDFEKPIVELEAKIDEMRKLGEEFELDDQIKMLEKRVDDLRLNVYKNLTRWQRVQIARHPERPITSNYIENVFDGFIELIRIFLNEGKITLGIIILYFMTGEA